LANVIRAGDKILGSTKLKFYVLEIETNKWKPYGWAKNRDVFTNQFHDDNFDQMIPLLFLNGRRVSQSKAIFGGEGKAQLRKNFANSNSVSFISHCGIKRIGVFSVRRLLNFNRSPRGDVLDEFVEATPLICCASKLYCVSCASASPGTELGLSEWILATISGSGPGPGH
jgi:hypothetical protein